MALSVVVAGNARGTDGKGLGAECSAEKDAFGSQIYHRDDFGGELCLSRLTQALLGLSYSEPGRFAITLQRGNRAPHLAKMGVHPHEVTAGASSARLPVAVRGKWNALDGTVDAGFFVSLTGGSIGM